MKRFWGPRQGGREKKTMRKSCKDVFSRSWLFSLGGHPHRPLGENLISPSHWVLTRTGGKHTLQRPKTGSRLPVLTRNSPPGRDLITPCGRTYLDSGLHTPLDITGTRQTPTTVPISSPLYPAPFPVRSTSPPHPFLCMQLPHATCLHCLIPYIRSFGL